MSNEYNYDNDAQFFPFFFLTVTSLVTIPLTYTLLRAPSDSATASKAPKIESPAPPSHADIIDTQRAKQKRKELRMKRIITAVTGWVVIAYMVYLMSVTARHAPKIWNPYGILDVGHSATEKQINSRYRKLSVTMHPDKRQPGVNNNLTSDAINDEWVEIVKAYKALTDEEIRNNFIQYGNPDGKQSTSFGIALPHFLIAEGSGKYVLIFYGILLGIGLPWLVGKWWYGMQKMTKERILVTSAGNMFKEFKDRMDGGDIASALSSAMEYQEILPSGKADAGLGKLENKIQATSDLNLGMLAKDKKLLSELDDATRRKTLALIWAYLGRVDLDDRTLEAEKYEIAPTALRLTEALSSIGLAYGFTQPVLSIFQMAQALTQAIPPTSLNLPLLQLPHFNAEIIQKIETKTASTSKEHLTIQSFMALPSEQRQALAQAAGLANDRLKQAEKVARQLPYLRIEKAFFKVQGEKHIIPSSLVQLAVKARFIPPGTTKIPPVAEADLEDPDPAEGDLKAQNKEVEQHHIPLAYAPYLPRDREPKWHIFLADSRQGKIAVPPFRFSTFDKPAFNEDGTPTFEVVTMKMQFQAPPQPGEFKFTMHIVCDSYVGFDYKQDVTLVIEDASKAVEVDSDDDISEPDEGMSIFLPFLSSNEEKKTHSMLTQSQTPSPAKWPLSRAKRPATPRLKRRGPSAELHGEPRTTKKAIWSPALMRTRTARARRTLTLIATKNRKSCVAECLEGLFWGFDRLTGRLAERSVFVYT
jgi:translocation protein SEC63